MWEGKQYVKKAEFFGSCTGTDWWDWEVETTHKTPVDFSYCCRVSTKTEYYYYIILYYYVDASTMFPSSSLNITKQNVPFCQFLLSKTRIAGWCGLMWEYVKRTEFFGRCTQGQTDDQPFC